MLRLRWFLVCIGVCVQLSIAFAQQALPGQIAFIGTDYNVYTLDFAANEFSQLTTNGATDHRYAHPVWSVDGRLAYFCCDLRTADQLDTSAYISADGKTTGQEVFSGRGEEIIYAAWSPSLCGAGCLDLALLVNDVFMGGLRVDLVRDEDESSVKTIAEGSPFYFSWSPNGEQIAFHRNNRSLDIYNVAAEEITSTSDLEAPGNFQAPAWSPVDDRILAGTRPNADEATGLTVVTPADTQMLLPEFGGSISFAWSPDGNYIAYRLIRQNEFGALFVLDAVTGEVVARSITSDVIAFFWSPNSKKIAYVTFGDSGGLSAGAGQFVSNGYTPVQSESGLAWSTLEIENALNRRYVRFIPTEELIYLLIYFDQFAQSHRVWSPDSRYLVYTEFPNFGEQAATVSILNTDEPNSVPLTVAEGIFAIWSYE